MRIIFLLFSLLTISCQREDIWDYDNNFRSETPLDEIKTNYTYSGTLGDEWNGNNPNNPLIGSTWVITRYNFNFNVLIPNDTIKFISNNVYLFNSSPVQRTYSINRLNNLNRFDLRINFLPTLGGGVYSGQLPLFFNEDGFINNAKFIDIEYNNKQYNVWLEKL